MLCSSSSSSSFYSTFKPLRIDKLLTVWFSKCFHTFTTVGIYLPNLVLSHGQLYVMFDFVNAFCRVRHSKLLASTYQTRYLAMVSSMSHFREPPPLIAWWLKSKPLTNKESWRVGNTSHRTWSTRKSCKMRTLSQVYDYFYFYWFILN